METMVPGLKCHNAPKREGWLLTTNPVDVDCVDGKLRAYFFPDQEVNNATLYAYEADPQSPFEFGVGSTVRVAQSGSARLARSQSSATLSAMNSYPPELLAQLAPVMFATGLDASNAFPQDPFSVLASRLREALLTQRKVAVWQPEKTKTFQVIVVDKEARFPPRKTVPLEDPQYSAAHSPLSPLTPTSPLHPDGLIAPIWVRKHTTMIPSVFVMFLRLYESPVPNPKSPLDAPDFDREREREQEERRRDAELSAEVALRKKATNERGIKLTVVLMATRRMLGQLGLYEISLLNQTCYIDDPALDHRLTYIRRQSGLDSRAALFVLSPVSPAELGDFITRHYQDAYDMLVIMFGSTVILPPRTKRWAEAKVLSDCINIKAKRRLNTGAGWRDSEYLIVTNIPFHHLTPSTIQQASCTSRASRTRNADDTRHSCTQACSATLHRGFSSVSASIFRDDYQGVEYDALRSLGLNPSHALQHPGFYYYMAAKCTELRRDKFQTALEAEVNFPSSDAIDTQVFRMLTFRSFRQLYTKSYELFKKYATSASTPKAQSQGRLTLWIAYRIAQTYYDSGKFDMAVREKWGSMLRPLLSTWYSCAQRLEDVELSVKLLVEMMGYDVADSEEPTTLQEDLVAILRSSVPSTEDQALVVDLPESQPMFKVDESAAFQLSLTAPSNVDISELPVSSLTIHFSGSINPVVIKHDGGVEEERLLEHCENRHRSQNLSLNCKKGAGRLKYRLNPRSLGRRLTRPLSGFVLYSR
ncbi:Trafficking protein particle complex [Salix suchowensis]|nr:Trafficking protein particle complex [Salix suchowensis]